MPTARQRHMITETDELSRAIDDAGVLWPENKGERTVLLRRIITAGIESVESASEMRKHSRVEALTKYAGKFSGMWPAGWHQTMVEEWPE